MCGNRKSTCYNGKEFLESVLKHHRENASGILRFGKLVTIKCKSQLWKTVAVNLQPETSPAQISHSHATTVARSTVERSVVHSTLITPFCLSFASCENRAVHNYISPYANYFAISYQLRNCHSLMVIIMQFTVWFTFQVVECFSMYHTIKFMSGSGILKV